MKIYCNKCKEDITVDVSQMFENFKIGKVTCKKCKKTESRYISESDLLLYYGLSEIIYVVISLITNYILEVTQLALWMIGVIIAILVVYYFVQRKITAYIYYNPPHKKDYKDFVFNENGEAIAKSMRWQFILFFAIAIYFIMGDKAKITFSILLCLSVVFTFVKFYLSSRNEKRIVEESKKA